MIAARQGRVLWTCITYDYNTILIRALNLLRREPRVEMSTSPVEGCETDARPSAETFEHSRVARVHVLRYYMYESR